MRKLQYDLLTYFWNVSYMGPSICLISCWFILTVTNWSMISWNAYSVASETHNLCERYQFCVASPVIFGTTLTVSYQTHAMYVNYSLTLYMFNYLTKDTMKYIYIYNCILAHLPTLWWRRYLQSASMKERSSHPKYFIPRQMIWQHKNHVVSSHGVGMVSLNHSCFKQSDNSR